MSETGKDHGPEVYTGELIHLSSIAIDRLVDESVGLVADSCKIEDVGKKLFQIVALFRTWDLATRKEFMSRLVRKEAEERVSFEEFAENRASGKIFPLGVSFESYFLEALGADQRLATFQETVKELTRETEPENAGEVSDVVSTFIASANRAFPDAERSALSRYLLESFVYDPEILPDVREEVIKRRLDVRVLDALSVIEDASLPERSAEQAALANIVLHENVGLHLKRHILNRHLRFVECPPELRTEIESIPLNPDWDNEVSSSVMSWLAGGARQSLDGGQEGFGIVRKVLDQREDAPSLQIEAMTILLFADIRRGPHQDKTTWSDVPAFIERLRVIIQESPESFENRFLNIFEGIARSPEGRVYMSEFLESDVDAVRWLSLSAALEVCPEIVTPEMVSEALGAFAAQSRLGQLQPSLENLFAPLINRWQFSSTDKLLLINWRNALTHSVATDNEYDYMVEELDKILSNLDT